MKTLPRNGRDSKRKNQIVGATRRARCRGSRRDHAQRARIPIRLHREATRLIRYLSVRHSQMESLGGGLLRCLLWGFLALFTRMLGALMRDRYRNSPARWSSFLVGDPHEGATLFFETKGCARCHAVNGEGGNSAPDLGFNRSPQSSVTQIVSAMWNHAPRMWEGMRAKKIAYPDLDHEDMANLFAFLYTARYVDEPGDERRGERLFASKGCVRCHGQQGTASGLAPDLSAMKGVDTPIVWAQTMWNHAQDGD